MMAAIHRFLRNRDETVMKRSPLVGAKIVESVELAFAKKQSDGSTFNPTGSAETLVDFNRFGDGVKNQFGTRVRLRHEERLDFHRNRLDSPFRLAILIIPDGWSDGTPWPSGIAVIRSFPARDAERRAKSRSSPTAQAERTPIILQISERLD